MKTSLHLLLFWETDVTTGCGVKGPIFYTFQTVVLNWSGFRTHHCPLRTSCDPNWGKMFNFSNLFNEKMVQFEPEIVQNITVCQNKKTGGGSTYFLEWTEWKCPSIPRSLNSNIFMNFFNDNILTIRNKIHHLLPSVWYIIKNRNLRNSWESNP